jgi:hypothetical protein
LLEPLEELVARWTRGGTHICIVHTRCDGQAGC